MLAVSQVAGGRKKALGIMTSPAARALRRRPFARYLLSTGAAIW